MWLTPIPTSTKLVYTDESVNSGTRTLPSLITIIPSTSPSTPILSAFREEGVKRFLFSLAERVGRMEVANRDLQQFLAGFIGTNHEDYVCPCCGSVLGQ